MPEMPQAEPCPDRPPLHLTGGYLAVASPLDPVDACFAAPALRALKRGRPQGTLVVCAPASLAPLWELMPEIDLTLSYPEKASPREIARLLKNTDLPFDSAIFWEKSPAALAFHKAKIKQRLAPPAKELQKLLTDPVPIIEKAGPVAHRVRHYLLFAEKLGLPAFERANFTPPPRPAAPSRPRLALVPDSDFGPSATWPVENFRELIRSLLAENDAELLLLSPPAGPDSAARALAAEFPELHHEPDSAIATLLPLLASCERIIANDGTLPHLAAHLGTPTLTLFGPNEPAWKRPLGTIHQSLREHVPCSPCFLPKCPLDHRCLQAITPAQVLAALSPTAS